MGSIASKNNGKAAVMVWNYHDVHKHGSACDVKALVNGLPAKKVVLTQYRIDDEYINSYQSGRKWDRRNAR